MPSKSTTLQNGTLAVTVRLPEGAQDSQRFDAAGVVEQVVLNGKHRFCQPEQLKADRVTCHGIGLCTEYDWNTLAQEAAPGQQFPKLGVGLLTQLPKGGNYDMWSHYEVEPFDCEYAVFEDRVEFTQQPKPCLGVAARIHKAVQLYRNTVTITTTIENVGQRDLDLYDYNHNFVAVDDLPVGPGYRLQLPFDGTVAEVANSGRSAKDMSPLPGLLSAEGDTVVWNQMLDETLYHKNTPIESIKTLPFYRWRLSHTGSPASISETCHFQPVRQVIWGIEHTISTEVYAKIDVKPGQRQSYARTWLFEDDTVNAAK